MLYQRGRSLEKLDGERNQIPRIMERGHTLETEREDVSFPLVSCLVSFFPLFFFVFTAFAPLSAVCFRFQQLPDAGTRLCCGTMTSLNDESPMVPLGLPVSLILSLFVLCGCNRSKKSA